LSCIATIKLLLRRTLEQVNGEWAMVNKTFLYWPFTIDHCRLKFRTYKWVTQQPMP